MCQTSSSVQESIIEITAHNTQQKITNNKIIAL